MKLTVELSKHSYPIYIAKGILNHIKDYLPDSRYFLLSDSGVPQKWIDLVAEQIEPAAICIIPQGESSKSFSILQEVLEQMAQANLSRKDAMICLGGGVVGDLGGFAASIYKRGIAFYNIPTTTLSQVDSSVGGKTAIDLGPYKNLVGSFWQPKAVFIDVQTLETLPLRHRSNGLYEALKMGLILDEDLVKEFEKEELDLEKIIARSIDLKRQIVEQDEKEENIRKILNFGHTLGHAIEGASQFSLLHGESVAAGMLFFLRNYTLQQRVKKIYEKLGYIERPLPEPQKIREILIHDKKGNDLGCSVILVKEAGKAQEVFMDWNDILSCYAHEIQEPLIVYSQRED